jgi:hypothetical protein
VVLQDELTDRWMLGARDYCLDFVQSRRNRVVVAFSWADKQGQRHRLVQGLRLRQGKIIDIQDFAGPKSAAALMGLRTAPG